MTKLFTFCPHKLHTCTIRGKNYGQLVCIGNNNENHKLIAIKEEIFKGTSKARHENRCRKWCDVRLLFCLFVGFRFFPSSLPFAVQSSNNNNITKWFPGSGVGIELSFVVLATATSLKLTSLLFYSLGLKFCQLCFLWLFIKSYIVVLKARFTLMVVVVVFISSFSDLLKSSPGSWSLYMHGI